jgi:uncharacterized protein (DUF4415 family)
MSKKLVRREFDLAHLPPLTAKQKAELEALDARPEGDIDYNEIPPLTAKFWSDATHGRFYKPVKTSTTVRIDADVLAWLRAQGKGYQSRINAILRREMLAATGTEVAGAFREEDRRSAKEPRLERRHGRKGGEIGHKREPARAEASRKR